MNTIRTRPANPLLSIVVPCYNEEAVIQETARRLGAAMREAGIRNETIYVNDGSRDRTIDLLAQLAGDDPTCRVINLSRNFGHQIAVTAGIDHAEGDAVVLIDADLQDPPEVIAEMVDRWRDGFDVVYGVRATREGETKFKLASAAAFYRLLNRFSEVTIPLDTGDFRLMDRRVVDALKLMPERYRFLRGMISWVGFRQCPLPYHRSARFAGESKYPFRKMVAFATDGLLSFTTKPLRLATRLGIVASVGAFGCLVYAGTLDLVSAHSVSTWIVLGEVVVLLGGLQLSALGVIGEYVGRIYDESKGRPLYLCEEIGARGVSSEEPALSGYAA